MSEKITKDHEDVLANLAEFKGKMLPLVLQQQKEISELGEVKAKTADALSKLENRFESVIETELKQAREDLKELKGLYDEMQLSKQRPSYGSNGSNQEYNPKSFGEIFVASPEFKHLNEAAQARSMRDLRQIKGVEHDEHKRYVEHMREQKSLITDDSFDSVRSVFTVDRLKKIYADPLRPNRVRDAFPIIPVTSNSVEYWVQTDMTTSGNMMVPENPKIVGATLKPETSFEGEVRTAHVRTLAHIMVTSTQLLDDAPAFAAHVDQYMRWGLDEKEDQQLLTGGGAGAEILGLLNVDGIQEYAWSDGATDDNILDAVVKGMTEVRKAYYPVDYAMCDPDVEQKLMLAKGNDGHYLWGVQSLANMNLVLRGVPVVATTAMPANQVVVGAFRMSTGLLDRMSLKMAVSDSHDKIFAMNMIAWRYEKRLGLMVPRPRGICLITLDGPRTS